MINEPTINVTSNYKSVENAIAKISTKQLILKNTEELFEDETKHLDCIFKIFCDENTRSFFNYVSPSHIKKMISEDLIFSNTHTLKSKVVHNN